MKARQSPGLNFPNLASIFWMPWIFKRGQNPPPETLTLKNLPLTALQFDFFIHPLPLPSAPCDWAHFLPT